MRILQLHESTKSVVYVLLNGLHQSGYELVARRGPQQQDSEHLRVERFVEGIRQVKFPHRQSRLTSIMVTDSIDHANDWNAHLKRWYLYECEATGNMFTANVEKWKAVKDVLDFRVHRNISVYQPKKDTYNN